LDNSNGAVGTPKSARHTLPTPQNSSKSTTSTISSSIEWLLVLVLCSLVKYTLFGDGSDAFIEDLVAFTANRQQARKRPNIKAQ
jgi:hypothetical protein